MSELETLPSHSDTKLQEQFKDELERYQRFNGVLGYIGEELIQKPAIDLKPMPNMSCKTELEKKNE
jgi:hypothetical protein